MSDNLRDENAELLAMLDADALTIGQLQFDNARLREILEEALEAWSAKLSMMPNIREREKLDAAHVVLENTWPKG